MKSVTEDDITKAYENEFDGYDPCEIVRELLGLRAEKAKLQEIWVTVVMSCTPPDDCNDPVVLKRYMKACSDKATEYEKEYPK